MPNRLTLLALAVLAPAAPHSDDSFESARSDFRRGVAALASEVDVSTDGLQEHVMRLAERTLGAHPELVREATLAALRDLPEFPASRLADLVERAPAVELPPLPAESGSPWLPLAGEPAGVGAWAKSWMLALQLDAETFGRRALLNSYCPDGTSRLGGVDHPALVVESLDDVFVVGVRVAARGELAPTSVRWLRPR